MDRRSAEETIGRAAQIDMEIAEKLRVEEVIEAAAEVGISERSVRTAIREKETIVRKRSETRRAILSVVVPLAVSVLIFFTALRSLASGRMELVEQKRSDVVSAIHRQHATIAIWSGPFDADRMRSRDAELMGAENRVRIAMHRYDLAAGRYNRVWFVTRIPLSNEVTQW